MSDSIVSSACSEYVSRDLSISICVFDWIFLFDTTSKFRGVRCLFHCRTITVTFNPQELAFFTTVVDQLGSHDISGHVTLALTIYGSLQVVDLYQSYMSHGFRDMEPRSKILGVIS